MSCSRDRIKDYFFGELSEGERSAVGDHMSECLACREEFERMRLTQAALRSVPDEEPPRRTAFVSDKVFEPNWWQRLWSSGARLGFASAGVLALAIVFHAVWQPAPAPVAVMDEKVIEARVSAEVERRLKPAVVAAVAESEARQARKTTDLIETARREFEFQRRADRVSVEEALVYLQKKYNVLYRISSNFEQGGRP
ncbi:MAG TPA: zf-HC2 domain-containing protein [Bryobacteraceae bacterium]|nr:zf-HC2 domain-containing protein [Bryobacteraceae bacterium]